MPRCSQICKLWILSFPRCKFAGVTCFLPYGTCIVHPAMAARTWWLVNTQWNQCDLQGFVKGQKGSPERSNVHLGNYKKWSEGVWITASFLASYPDLFLPLYQYLLIYFQLVLGFSYCLSFSIPQNKIRSLFTCMCPQNNDWQIIGTQTLR